MRPLGVAFAVAFVAELGDKSQLLVLALATRYRPWPVLAGLVLGTVGVMGVSVGVGAALGAALPATAVMVGAGLAFLVFAVLSLRTEADDDIDSEPPVQRAHFVVLGVALAIFVAELGDKTMLATLALAATQAPLPTWIGASAGMVAGSGLALIAGTLLGTRVPERAARYGAAALFALFGVLLLGEALRA